MSGLAKLISVWRSRSPSVENLITLLISTLATLVVLELALKFLAPLHLTGGYIGAYKYDELLGATLKENLRSFKTTDYQQEIRTNKLGTVNFQDSFDNYANLIFAIGDSFTQGTGVPADASYPFQLDLILNQSKEGNYKPEYAVVNLGLSAFGAEQELLSLQIYSKRIGKPKYVLYLGCDNDFDDDLRFKSGYRHRHLVQGNPYWGVWLSPLQWVTQETEIGKRLNLAYIGVRPNVSEDRAISEASVAEREATALKRIFETTKELGARLIVSWANKSNSYHWLKRWAEVNDVAFADWGPLFETVKVAYPNIPVENSHSGGHYRAWVNNMIARAYAKEVKRLEELR